MKKEDFKRAVRDRLDAIPLDERKTWNGTELFVWWTEVSGEDSYLRWERCPGDLWQSVHGFCKDMIGPNARS